MASQKNNYVVNYFTLDISEIINRSNISNQSSIECEYEILSSEMIDQDMINSNNDDDNVNNIIEDTIIEQNDCKNDYDTNQDVTTSDDEDDDLQDLTNLNWLTELKNITNLPPTTNEVTEKPCDPPSQRFDKFINQVHKIKENYEKRSEIYQNVSSEKPPYNYAQIIAMAMLDDGRMTLKQICDWIENRFAYYKVHNNWNVRIIRSKLRYTLMINNL